MRGSPSEAPTLGGLGNGPHSGRPSRTVTGDGTASPGDTCGPQATCTPLEPPTCRMGHLQSPTWGDGPDRLLDTAGRWALGPLRVPQARPFHAPWGLDTFSADSECGSDAFAPTERTAAPELQT